MGLEALVVGFNLSCVPGQCLTLAKQPVHSFNTCHLDSFLEVLLSLPDPQRLNSLWIQHLSDNCYSYFLEKTPEGKFAHSSGCGMQSLLFAKWIWEGPWLLRRPNVNIMQVFSSFGHQVLFKLLFECFVPCYFQLFKDWAEPGLPIRWPSCNLAGYWNI